MFRLYDDGMSIRNIGEHYGVSYGRIHRILEEQGKECCREIQNDPDIIHRLYFEEGLFLIYLLRAVPDKAIVGNLSAFLHRGNDEFLSDT
ncbi:MAG: helix-turn-helix domain-containing protein [Candidatus Thorarchaeota archaeon]